MVAQQVTDLGTVADRVRERQISLDEQSSGMSQADLNALVRDTRTALREIVEQLPEAAFEAQENDGEGNEVWSAGEVVIHSNEAFYNIGGRGLEIMEIETAEIPAEVAKYEGPQVLSRDEVMSAVDAVDADAFFAQIPDGADLEASQETDFFGKMSARAWLYFIAVHEADHIEQLDDLRQAHS